MFRPELRDGQLECALEVPTGMVSDFSALALKVQAAALSHARFDEAATAFVTELGLALGCDRVTLGLRKSGVTLVVAGSHAVDTNFSGALYRDVSDAMDEAIDQCRILLAPDSPESKPAILVAHRRLRTHLGGVVQTVPLRVHEAYVGAVCFEWSTASAPLPPTPLQSVIDLVGPVLFLMHRAERGWRERIRDALADAGRRLSSEEGRQLRWGLGAVFLIVAAALWVPVDQHVSARTRLEGSIEQVVASPVDGFIESVMVRPGDVVKAGQVVVALAGQDLELEARRWQSALTEHEGAYMAALARSDRSAMMVGLAKAEEARASLELAQRNLERAHIVAGMDGVVISGDVSRLRGGPVSRGDVLLTLAPIDGYRVVLEVDERDIGRLEEGQRGVMALGAQPDWPLGMQISRITPMAEVIDGNNVYRVEARLDAEDKRLRPGLAGVSRVNVGREPLAGAAWHWLSNRLRSLWWRWGG